MKLLNSPSFAIWYNISGKYATNIALKNTAAETNTCSVI